MLVSAGLGFLFPGTKDTDLEDTIHKSVTPRRNDTTGTDRKVIHEAVTPLMSIECIPRTADAEDEEIKNEDGIEK